MTANPATDPSIHDLAFESRPLRGHQKVLAVIVSFNGESKLLATVDALRDQVDHIHIVDNASGRPTAAILNRLEAFPNLSITRLPENLGIGAALNVGVIRAREGGYEWLLTMDQDSLADPGMVGAFQKVIKVDPTRKCLAPSLVVHGVRGEDQEGEVAYAITSGNFINMDVFEQIGMYNTDMFIDCIDFDFCLRWRATGQKVYRVNSAILGHELGEWHQTSGWLSKYYTQHSPLRRYYMYRNFLLLWKLHFKRFPKFFLKSGLVHLILIIAILRYDKAPWESILAIGLGLFDFSIGHTGKCIRNL